MDHEDSNNCSEQSPENWFNSFEEECLLELDQEPNMEETLQAQREYLYQKLWLQFQNSATAIAQLYKDKHQGLSLWIPFQNAASAVTSLYKDNVECMRMFSENGVQCGRHHRTKDIVAWARKKRRHIRREDLLAFLCNKNPPQRTHRHHHSGPNRHSQGSRLNLERSHSPRILSAGAEGSLEPSSAEPDLQAFREAIALQGLNGAMSNVSVGYNRSHATPTPQQIGSIQRGGGGSNMEELNRFIIDEFSRNYDNSTRKRTSSPDVLMDSPSRKRGRFF
ncbi:hypothetical protein KUTeg_003240 [Tegillarca granosa]|uniref:Uncharacterized protein n=1 Tax=Tegillarca granosa TaxID=220873 RepID=A0ABQ9FLK4_TEGGR|nr:hypothetical protein KUTeg_003240 [Tegillarca granosa]